MPLWEIIAISISTLFFVTGIIMYWVVSEPLKDEDTIKRDQQNTKNS